jgi:hypothetical protein
MRRPSPDAERRRGGRTAVVLPAIVPVAVSLVVALVLSLGALAAGKPGAGSAAGEPEYPHGDFQGDCSECHGDQGWKPARISRKFDHAKRSGFALNGAHAALKCASCHATLDFTRQRQECASCHQDPHLGELGPDCARCHTTRGFLDRAGMVRLHQLTRLPLTGAHAALDCEGCHARTAQGHLRFAATRAACDGCHQPGTVPDHRAFGADCARCHTTISWQPARFDHAGTGFPLTCPHRPPVTCVQCHGTPWTNALPRDCYACHQAAYAATTDPPHAAAGFPTSCTTCHDVNVCGWTGASFDHSGFFPLAGSHASTACATCHTVPGDYATFNCLTGGCHPKSTTDSRHGDVGSYRYESAACYSCHPRATAGD